MTNKESPASAEEIRSLESAYIAMLRMPHGAFRARHQFLFCILRDVLAEMLGKEEMEVQDEYTFRATAASGVKVPDGWKPIQREPTQEMMDAFNSGRDYLTWGDCFRRMWDAAPTPPVVKESLTTEEVNLLTLLRQACSELSHYETCPQGTIPVTGDCECFAGELMKRIDAAITGKTIKSVAVGLDDEGIEKLWTDCVGLPSNTSNSKWINRSEILTFARALLAHAAAESKDAEIESLKMRLARVTDPKVLCHRGNAISLNCPRSSIDLFVERAIANKDTQPLDPARTAEFWAAINAAIGAAQSKEG